MMASLIDSEVFDDLEVEGIDVRGACAFDSTDILTPDPFRLEAGLHGEFSPRRNESLAARAGRHSRLDADAA